VVALMRAKGVWRILCNMFVELDTRQSDGLTVSLEWDPDSGGTQIVVQDARDASVIVFGIQSADAADAFRHPYVFIPYAFTSESSQMRLWGSGKRRAAADNALAAYVEWRRECDAVRVAYRTWRDARALDEPRAFDAYKAALDREESAAVLFARRMRRAHRLAETGLA
jgi:hypothetical protein